MRSSSRFFAILLWLIGVETANAQRKPAIPAPLQPWVSWALYESAASRCPPLNGNAKDRVCAFATRLALDLNRKGGRFEQLWTLFDETALVLPGDPTAWPTEVQLNGKPAVVVARAGKPVVFANVGQHRLTGRFAWNRLPHSLSAATETGLISLRINGQERPATHRDRQGRLVLQGKVSTRASSQDRLQVRVHRRLTDGVPFLLETRLRLDVAGKSRSMKVSHILPRGFLVHEIDSALPAQWSDGQLELQLRPGSWNITIRALSRTKVEAMRVPRVSGRWSDEEVWVFAADASVRVVTPEGLPSIDPQQTSLPRAWRELPAFRARPQETLTLKERQRGDANPAPDRLTLKRRIMLDFDGGGYTQRDYITGRLSRSWRLDMQQGIELGRVAINGQDQFITRNAQSDHSGIEVRQGTLNIEADSRGTGAVSRLLVAGWNHDFERVSATLRLPPGWKLLHAFGVDSVDHSWLKDWSLLDLFLLMVLTVAFARLFSFRVGVVAFFALALTLPESDAPRWIWVILLPIVALERGLQDGRAARLLRTTRLGLTVLLLLLAVPFLVQQVRQGLHPALERDGSWPSFIPGGAAALRGDMAEPAVNAPQPAPPKEPVAAASAEQTADSAQRRDSGRISQMASALTKSGKGKRGYYGDLWQDNVANLQQHDPDAMVQTGPGVPNWSWRSVRLGWSGPVERDQQMRLLLLSPGSNLLLGLARALSLSLLIALALGLRWRGRGQAPRAGALSLLVLLLCVPGGIASAQTIPSDNVLAKLRKRLTKAPACSPDCAVISAIIVRADPKALQLQLAIDAAGPSVIALPGNAKHWLPRAVLLDGRPAAELLRRGDTLWLGLAHGRHRVMLTGRLPAKQTVQIALPQRPYRVSHQLSGWRIDGIGENGRPEQSLQLTRLAGEAAPAATSEGNSLLASLVEVKRHLMLGLSWRLRTTVRRAGGQNSAVVLQVPLLRGESVTSATPRIVNGKAQVNLAPQQQALTWDSVLRPTAELSLRAAKVDPWVETWQVTASAIWHVQSSGIPPTAPTSAQDLREPIWRPWPGETLLLQISRPKGIVGRTLTVDSSRTEITPGARSTKVRLLLSLRASRGVQHTITLPADATLKSVKVDGSEQPIRQRGNRVTLPIAPGAHSAQLDWIASHGVTARYRAPSVDLGAPSVNATTQLSLPDDRWVLLVGGGGVYGPAVLFWSRLAVWLLLAWGLTRLRLADIRIYEWMLLAVGLTQVPNLAAAMVIGWLLVLGWRRKTPSWGGVLLFNMRQLSLLGWTLIALAILAFAIQQGLLGSPRMQVTGNGSHAYQLRWFADRAQTVLPRPWVISAPMLIYRLAMLGWALWLALALLRWLPWAWHCFVTGGGWRPLHAARAQPATPADHESGPNPEG